MLLETSAERVRTCLFFSYIIFHLGSDGLNLQMFFFCVCVLLFSWSILLKSEEGPEVTRDAFVQIQRATATDDVSGRTASLDQT